MYGMQESFCAWVRYRTNKAVCSWLSLRHSWLCRMREWRRCCGIFHFIIVGDAWLKIIGSYARYVAIKQGWRSEKTPYLKISLCTVRSAGRKPLSMWNNFIQQLSKSQTHRRRADDPSPIGARIIGSFLLIATALVSQQDRCNRPCGAERRFWNIVFQAAVFLLKK